MNILGFLLAVRKSLSKRSCTNITDLSNRFSRNFLLRQESHSAQSSKIDTASFIHVFCSASTGLSKVSLWCWPCGGASLTVSNITGHGQLEGNGVLNWEQLSNWTGKRRVHSRHDIYGELEVQLHSFLISSPDGFNFKHWPLYQRRKAGGRGWVGGKVTTTAGDQALKISQSVFRDFSSVVR
jgi:hypothetical protein